jgi:hypothetical protein
VGTRYTHSSLHIPHIDTILTFTHGTTHARHTHDTTHTKGQTKARSAAEAGIDGGKTLGKKKSKLGLKKKGLGTGRSVELILPPDYEYIQRIRKEVAAAAASAAEDKKRKGACAVCAV